MKKCDDTEEGRPREMDQEDHHALRPDSFDAAAQAEACRADRKEEVISNKCTGQIGTLFGADKGERDEDRTDGKGEKTDRP